MSAEVIPYHDAIATFDRDRTAYDLKLRGHSERRIAEDLNCSMDQVHASIARMQGAVAPNVRRMEAKTMAERCNALLAGHFEKACQGDVMATKLVLEILERQARLMGLDAPASTSNVFAETAPENNQTSTDKIRKIINLVVAERPNGPAAS